MFSNIIYIKEFVSEQTCFRTPDLAFICTPCWADHMEIKSYASKKKKKKRSEWGDILCRRTFAELSSLKWITKSFILFWKLYISDRTRFNTFPGGGTIKPKFKLQSYKFQSWWIGQYLWPLVVPIIQVLVVCVMMWIDHWGQQTHTECELEQKSSNWWI